MKGASFEEVDEGKMGWAGRFWCIFCVGLFVGEKKINKHLGIVDVSKNRSVCLICIDSKTGLLLDSCCLSFLPKCFWGVYPDVCGWRFETPCPL